MAHVLRTVTGRIDVEPRSACKCGKAPAIDQEETMKLATLQGHDPACTGCPACSEEMARVLAMPPEEHCRWLKERNKETARVLRVASCPGGAACKCGEHRAPDPPDMAGRIRSASQPSPLREVMTAGISYDHM